MPPPTIMGDFPFPASGEKTVPAKALKLKMDEAWELSLKRFYSPVTHQFYDYLTSGGDGLEHLPYPEEIRGHFPNPCGWGTGMEDSMLLAGSVIDILRMRWRSGDEEAPRMAERVLAGIRLSCSAHGVPGFVARSISPRDGKSAYINSSRDQFTLAVYGTWRFYHEKWRVSEEAREMAAGILVDIAAYCERTVKPANGFNLSRLDGRTGLVSKMWEVEAHEALRLPMIYLAAYSVTGDERWHKLYRRYAMDAAKATLRPKSGHRWWDIELSQLQYSLTLVSSLEDDRTVNRLYREAQAMAREESEHLLSTILREARTLDFCWNAVNDDFRTMLFKLRKENTESGMTKGFYGGLGYFLPQFPDSYAKPTGMLRSIGNLCSALSLSTDGQKDDALVKEGLCVIDMVDYELHKTSSCLNALQGYWLMNPGG